MRKPSDETPDWEAQRSRIIGLGETSVRKSYYPELQQRIHELEKKNQALNKAYAEQTAVEEELRQQFEETLAKEKELRASEERFRSLIAASPVPIMLARDGIFLYTNPAFCRMTGYDSPDELIGKKLLDLIAPEFHDTITGFIRTRSAGMPAETHYEAVGIKKDGTRFPYEITIAVISLSDGPVTMAFVTETTARKAAEAALAKSQSSLKRAEIIAGIGHWEFHLDSRIVLASDSARSIYGLAGEEWTIPDVKKIPLPEYRAMLDQALQALIEGKRPYDVEFRICRPSDGKMVDIHSIAEYDEKTHVVFGVIQDITDRKRAEASVRESEQRFARFMDNLPAAVYIKDLNGNVLFSNRYLNELFGWTDPVGKSTTDLLPSEVARAMVEDDRNAFREGILSLTETIPDVHGCQRVFSTTKFSVSDPGGTPLLGGISLDITERRRAEEELMIRTEQLHTLINTMPDIVCFKDGQGRWLEANAFDLDLFQLTGVDYKGKKDSELAPFSPFYHDAFLACEESDNAAWERGTISRGEEVIPRPDGTSKTFDIIKVPLFNPDGSRKGLVVVGRDITERKRAEAALRENMTKYRDIVETTPDLIWEIDDKGIFKFLSPQCHAILGYPPESLIGKPFRSLLIPEQVGSVMQEFEAQVRKEIQLVTILVVVQHPDGRKLDMEIRSARVTDEQGNLIGFRGITRDVTQQRKAEDALRISEERYRSLVDITDTGYLVLDHNGLVLDANDVYVRLTGRQSLDELRGLAVTEWTAPHDLERNAREVERCLKTGRVRGLEVDYLKPDGTIQPVEINATVFHAESGDVILTLCRDILERRQANVALQQARNKLNLLNAVTFQDIRTAAFSLSAYLELVKTKLTDEKSQSYVEKQELFLKKMTDTLEFARNYQEMGMHPPRWQNVRQVFLYAISHLDFLHMKQRIEFDDLEVFADPLFEKALFSIMDNSLRHGSRASEVGLRYEERLDGLVLFITDNGVGIPAEEKNMIFDRGYGRGSGLGLFLVREVLSITGMTVKETGVPGQGMRLEIFIPRGMYRIAGPDTIS